MSRQSYGVFTPYTPEELYALNFTDTPIATQLVRYPASLGKSLAVLWALFEHYSAPKCHDFLKNPPFPEEWAL